MQFQDYCRYDALGLANLVYKKEVSAQQLLQAATARLHEVNPRLNCVIHDMTDTAFLASHEAKAGPFCQVPFLLKDLFQDYAGHPATHGSQALQRAQYRPERHNQIVKRFLASGVNIMGKTNTPEFGAQGITEPKATGQTCNPWQLEHSPGGSSGGAAAAVAAGIVPMAGASDGGGSIRIPASCCGLFGFKPGRAITPAGPEAIDVMHGAMSHHVLTRSVRDSAAMLDAIAGYETGAIVRAELPATAYSQHLTRPPAPLRIGVMEESAWGRPHADVQQALQQTINLLEDLGHRVEPARPRVDNQQSSQDFLSIWFAQIGYLVRQYKSRFNARWQDFELETRVMAHLGSNMTAHQYIASLQRWADYRYALAQFHQHYDLLLCPTMASPPPRLGQLAPSTWQRTLLKQMLRLPANGQRLLHSGLIAKIANDNLRHMPFTQLANITGTPAMSVPLHTNPAGLPIGSQFIGPHGSEPLLLALAAQLETAQPWFDHLPYIADIDTL